MVKPPQSSSHRPPHPSRPKAKVPRRRRVARGLLITAGLLGASIASATVGALLAFSLSSTPLLQTELTAEESAVFAAEGDLIDTGGLRISLPRLTRPVNILVLGTKVLTTDVDNAPAEVQGLGYHALVNSFDGLTDTMVLMRFDPFTKQLSVLSVPRDTRAYVDGYGLTKINEANVYGGPALTAQSVSELLNGVQIDRYVRINVQGVEKLIDALGGVSLYVPQDMRYQDDSQHLYINLKEGEQHLDGNKSLQFLRFRYDSFGDIGRIQRQQTFMRALTEQALTPRTVGRLPKIVSVIRENLDTNLSVEELSALVGFARKTDRANVQMLMLPGDFSDPDSYEASYWLPNYNEIDTLAYQYFDTGSGTGLETVTPSGINIAVQNSNGEEGAGETLANALYDRGYTNVYVDGDWPEVLATTRIIAQRGNRQEAEAIQQSLGFGEVWVESTGTLMSDVTIRLGTDWFQQAQL
ncbi:LytR family transcriptional regulator [Prochlorothrix hollandica PCC 9006 = CALU 1027]|uniref:LytR family transcriptional regulator n=1 Tax=Prochlorothrix hollandica PCC 9006 = CALU 1027 TaxID=317619 RepID=A0A0M2PTH1_PROHO|nr:LytR family transcriptional regulator [Prochlorothrix hollandica PCC 9006 = CALU 1027]